MLTHTYPTVIHDESGGVQLSKVLLVHLEMQGCNRIALRWARSQYTQSWRYAWITDNTSKYKERRSVAPHALGRTDANGLAPLPFISPPDPLIPFQRPSPNCLTHGLLPLAHFLALSPPPHFSLYLCLFTVYNPTYNPTFSHSRIAPTPSHATSPDSCHHGVIFLHAH